MTHLDFAKYGVLVQGCVWNCVRFKPGTPIKVGVLDLADRLVSFLESGSNSRQHVGRVTEPATRRQLGLLSRLGIRPLWIATQQEANELICQYRAIWKSAESRIP